MTSKAMLWVSYVMSAIPAMMVGSSGLNIMRKADFLLEGFAKQGIPLHTMPAIGLAAFVAALLYVVPRTSVLGAILMTGYLGGAVFVHIRVDEPIWFVPVIFGILTWGGLYLRNERLRTLIPLTNP